MRASLFAAAGLCVPAAVAHWFIRGKEISHARARQSSETDEAGTGRWRDLIENRPLLIFAGCLFLFQLTSASVLPLASERLAANFESGSALVTPALVVCHSS